MAKNFDDYPGPEPIDESEWTKGYKFKSGKTEWIIRRRRKPPTPRREGR